MKKIVALVLCLALALSLCTVAFAAADKYDLYLANSTNLKDGAVVKGYTPAYPDAEITEYAAKSNSDGSGNVAYLTAKYDSSGTKYASFQKTTAPTITSYAVTADGKTDILFYVNKLVDNASDEATAAAGAAYVAEGVKFADFGIKAGQIYLDGTTDYDYYKITKTSNATTATKDSVYSDDTETAAICVDGKLVKVGSKINENATAGALANNQLVKANYVVSATKFEDGKTVPTAVTETTTGTVYTAIYKDGKAPAGSKVYDFTYASVAYEVVITAASNTIGSTTTVESAKTFDAGIALYAGMALASVAGSAVVIGKKKEF